MAAGLAPTASACSATSAGGGSAAEGGTTATDGGTGLGGAGTGGTGGYVLTCPTMDDGAEVLRNNIIDVVDVVADDTHLYWPFHAGEGGADMFRVYRLAVTPDSVLENPQNTPCGEETEWPSSLPKRSRCLASACAWQPPATTRKSRTRPRVHGLDPRQQ